MKTVYAKTKNGDNIGFRTPESLVYISSSETLTDKLNSIDTLLNNIITAINAINTELNTIESGLK